MSMAPVQWDGSVDAIEHQGIVTPEAVVLDVETAGFASRILAGLLDLTIQVVVIFFFTLVLSLAFVGDESGTVTAFAVIFFLVFFGYPIVFETLLRGRTPGKMALGIRAVTIDGAPIRLRETTLRAMGGVVDLLLPPGGVTGALFVLFTPRHQTRRRSDRGHDRDSRSRTVRRHPGALVQRPAGLEAYAETIDPTAITVEQYTVIRSFLTRGSALAPTVRNTIAIDLANRLAAEIRHLPPQWVPPEAFLLCAMARYQRRNGPGRATTVPAPPWAGPGMPGPPGGRVVHSLDR